MEGGGNFFNSGVSVLRRFLRNGGEMPYFSKGGITRRGDDLKKDGK